MAFYAENIYQKLNSCFALNRNNYTCSKHVLNVSTRVTRTTAEWLLENLSAVPEITWEAQQEQPPLTISKRM